jgi:hypothetical protein
MSAVSAHFCAQYKLLGAIRFMQYKLDGKRKYKLVRKRIELLRIELLRIELLRIEFCGP